MLLDIGVQYSSDLLTVVLSKICLHLIEQCLYCPFKYSTLTSSMTVFHSTSVWGTMMRSVTGLGRCFRGVIGEGEEMEGAVVDGYEVR